MLSEGSTPEEAEIIGEHFAYLQRLTAEGVAILVGRTLTIDQDSMGIVIFTARSEDEARALMEADPAVSKGVMSAKLFPFRIVLQTATNDHNVGIQIGAEER